jgi:hypothetical protein
MFISSLLSLVCPSFFNLPFGESLGFDLFRVIQGAASFPVYLPFGAALDLGRRGVRFLASCNTE